MPGLVLVLAVALRQSGVPLTARVRHCKPAPHGAGSVAGASLAAAPARPVGTPPGLGRGWEVMGSVGAESPVRPSLLPGRCLAPGQSRVPLGQRFPHAVPQFPHL